MVPVTLSQRVLTMLDLALVGPARLVIRERGLQDASVSEYLEHLNCLPSFLTRLYVQISTNVPRPTVLVIL